MGELPSRIPIKRAFLKTNNIPVYSWANRLFNTSMTAFSVGTANDPKDFEGAAHAWEHVICRRSSTYTGEEVDLKLERLFGGSDGDGIDISTQYTELHLAHDDLSNKKELREGFLLMASFAYDSVIECRRPGNNDTRLYQLNDLRVERAAVHNETKFSRHDLFSRVSEAIPKALYTTNPCRLWGCANLKQLRRVSLGRLKQWASAYFGPKSLMVALIGPTQDTALEWVAEARLDTLKDYHTTKLAYDHSDDQPVLDGVREVVIEHPGAEQLHVALAWPTETFKTKDWAALEVLARIMKARIENVLRENNTDFDAGVYHPAVEWDATKYHGCLQAWFATVGDAAYARQAEEQMLRICRELKDDTSTRFDQQVEAIRLNLVSRIHQEWRWFPALIANRVAEHFCNGDPDLLLLESLKHRRATVKPKDVRAVANKYLNTDAFVRVVLRPLQVSQDIYDRATEESKPYLKPILKPTD